MGVDNASVRVGEVDVDAKRGSKTRARDSNGLLTKYVISMSDS